MRRWLTLVLGLVGSPAVAEGEGFEALVGHGGPVMGAAVSADGQAALTASFDNALGLWELSTGAVHWLDGHGAAVKAVAFLPDGRAVSGGDDFMLRLWDLGTGDSAELAGHTAQVKAVAVSPDGALIASASWDRTVGLWDAGTGALLARLEGHDGPVNDVVFADGGRALYSASSDGTVRLWDVETRTERRTVLRHGFGTSELLIDEAGGWLAYGATDGGTRVIDLATDAVLADLTLERRPILAMAASPDGGEIAVGDGEGFVMVVRTGDWRILHDYRATTKGPVWALAYTADGARLLMGGIEDSAYLWPVGETGIGPVMTATDRAFLRDPAEMSNGERQFQRKCSICHSLEADGGRKAGPTLHGVFGRRAGALEGYLYSQTLDGSDIVWTEATIDRLFDLGPDHYIPGSKMPMQRIVRPEDRRDLIDWLKKNT
ncbi:MAG: c-type cytochrome [Paracoccaceae bacterium]|nr:c-type cytochrome [Paracoccaceae bacterium]